MKEIAITDCNHGFLDPELDACSNDFEISYKNLSENSTEQEIIEACKDASIIVTQRVQITGDMARQFSRCKVIARYGVGLDNLAVDELEEQGIEVINFPTFCTEEVANHATALILFLYRRLGDIYRISDTKGLAECWGKPDFISNIQSAGETTVGIIGAGNIGKDVISGLKSLGFRVLAYDPYIENIDYAELVDSLEKLFLESDIISVHCPLSKETEGMIDKKLFNLVKKDFALVNTSRGRVVNQRDLEDCLYSGKIRAACIDVCDPEPPLTDTYNVPNLYITPHVAFYSKQSLNYLKTQVISESIEAFYFWNEQ